MDCCKTTPLGEKVPRICLFKNEFPPCDYPELLQSCCESESLQIVGLPKKGDTRKQEKSRQRAAGSFLLVNFGQPKNGAPEENSRCLRNTVESFFPKQRVLLLKIGSLSLFCGFNPCIVFPR